MAGRIENLIFNSERSSDEVRKNSSKGGINSGKTRSMRAKAKKIAALNVSDDEIISLMELFGIEDKDIGTAMIFVQMLKAIKSGDTAAFKAVLELLGEDAKHEELALRKQELKLKLQSAEKNAPTAETETPKLYEALQEVDKE